MHEGRIIKGTYRIEQRIGSGGMAAVYSAVHVELGRRCAIKQLKEQFAERPDVLRRFRREARSMADLIHPNIVHVFDYGVEEGFGAYLVMDLIDGTDLGQIIRERGALPFAEVARIGSQVAGALEQAHRRGLIHRDIKPGNILIERGSGRALVADFGIAKQLDPGDDDTATQTEGFIGTSRYSSPEQLHAEDLDARADLYALGAVLYEMASGKRFLEGLRDAEIVLHVLGNPPVWPPVDYAVPVPEGFVQLVEDCLQRQRDQRIRSAAVVIERLEQCRNQPLVQPPRHLLTALPGSSSTVVPEEATQATHAAARRGRRRSAAPWFAAVAIVATGAVATLLWRRSELTAPPPRQEPLATVAPGPPTSAPQALEATKAVPEEVAARPPQVEVKPTAAVAAPAALVLTPDPVRLTTLAFGTAQRFRLKPPADMRAGDLRYDWQLAGRRVSQEAQFAFANTDAELVRGQVVQLAVVATDESGRTFRHTWDFKIVPPAPRVAQAQPPAGELRADPGKTLRLALTAAPAIGNQTLSYVFNTDGKDHRSAEPVYELQPSGSALQVVEARVADNYGQESAAIRWTIRGVDLVDQTRRWLEEYRAAFADKNTDKLSRMLRLAPEKQAALRKQLEMQNDLRVAFQQVQIEKLGDGRVRATYERQDSFRNPSTGAVVEPPPVRVEQVFREVDGEVQLER